MTRTVAFSIRSARMRTPRPGPRSMCGPGRRRRGAHPWASPSTAFRRYTLVDCWSGGSARHCFRLPLERLRPMSTFRWPRSSAFPPPRRGGARPGSRPVGPSTPYPRRGGEHRPRPHGGRARKAGTPQIFCRYLVIDTDARAHRFYAGVAGNRTAPPRTTTGGIRSPGTVKRGSSPPDSLSACR